MQVKSSLPHPLYSEADPACHEFTHQRPVSTRCASFVNANNRALQHASISFKDRCDSLKTKLNLHKGRVRHSRLRVLSWIQCGALDTVKKNNAIHFKPIPKELGSSDCE
jgi:hypothetical protein